MYATAAEFIDEFGQGEAITLTDRERTGEINEARLTAKLVEASGEIDGYLQARGYPLPLPRIPLKLRRICFDLARYYLSAGEVLETKEVKERYDQARRDLEKIMEGRLSLGVDVSQVPVADGPSIVMTAPPRVFTHKTLGDY